MLQFKSLDTWRHTTVGAEPTGHLLAPLLEATILATASLQSLAAASKQSLAPPQQIQTWRSAAVKSIFDNLFETIRVPASTPAACPREPAQLHKVSGQLFPKQDSSVGARTQGPRVDIEEEQEDVEREPHSRKAALAGVHQQKLTDVQGAVFFRLSPSH